MANNNPALPDLPPLTAYAALTRAQLAALFQPTYAALAAGDITHDEYMLRQRVKVTCENILALRDDLRYHEAKLAALVPPGDGQTAQDVTLGSVEPGESYGEYLMKVRAYNAD